MKREFKPLDLAPGFRLYEAVLSWCLKDGRQGSERYVVAADSPNQTPHSAANEIRRIYAESYDNNPQMSYWDVKGYALNVLQPVGWFRDGTPDFFSGLSIPESEEIAKAAQEEVDHAFGLAPKDLNLTPPKITAGVVWAVVRAYFDTVRDLSKRG
jgi:hypothetical protein